MLVLSNIHSLLTQVLALPQLHTIAVFTPAGQLVSYVSDPSRSKDEVLLIVGLSGEVWQGTRDQGYGMMDCDEVWLLVRPSISDAMSDLSRSEDEDHGYSCGGLGAEAG